MDEEIQEMQVPKGELLDNPDNEKVAKKVIRFWDDDEKSRVRRNAYGKVNQWRRMGYRWCKVKYHEDEADYEAWRPLGSDKLPPSPNKLDRLLRRVTATLLNDPPKPEAQPERDEDEAVDAAEFTTRVLTVEGSESRLNFRAVMEEAFDRSHTFGSGFSYTTVDPFGGGARPKSMMAHPEALHSDNALVHPETGLPPEPELDETGEQVSDGYAERFVRPDGSLSDVETEADQQFLPSLKICVLDSRQVTFIPEYSKGISDATGVVILEITNLGELRGKFPEVRNFSPDEQKELADFKPKGYDDVLPPWSKDLETPEPNDDGNYPDHTPVCTLSLYMKGPSKAYPKGAYIVVCGDKKVLHKEEWAREIEDSEGNASVEYLDIPLAQLRSLNDYVLGDPHGIAFATNLGAAEELRYAVLGYAMEYLHRFVRPHTFLPVGSIVQPKQMDKRDGKSVIFFNPNGKPEFENVPEFLREGPALRNEMTSDMDDETGLQQAAQGVEDASVKSGVHAETIVEQALVALSQVREHGADFFKRTCRICTQMMRVFYTTEQRLRYLGEDGAYKEQNWTGVDLGDTRIISIARGSYTMQTPSSKRRMVTEMMAIPGMMDVEEAKRLMRGSIDPILGMRDNPHFQRVNRQIDEWQKGPTKEFEQAYPQIQAMQQQQQAEAQTFAAQGMMYQPKPLPALPSPFDRLPVDLEQPVATIRHAELARAMASSKYRRLPPEWQQVFNTEYEAMKRAAGIATVEERQIAQQQQAAQAQQNALAVVQEKQKPEAPEIPGIPPEAQAA